MRMFLVGLAFVLLTHFDIRGLRFGDFAQEFMAIIFMVVGAGLAAVQDIKEVIRE